MPLYRKKVEKEGIRTVHTNTFKENHMELYDIFKGDALRVAQKIQQRRLQMLVHSAIYYIFNDNIISDSTWSRWAAELKDLQFRYPDISKAVKFGDVFKDWDASTGFNLPINDPWVLSKAEQLIGRRSL